MRTANEARRAHTAVKSAIRLGTLVKAPCEVCGEGEAQAHHDDYDSPLKVRWLCPKHHREHHARHRSDVAWRPDPELALNDLLPAQLRGRLEQRAAALGMTTSEFLRYVITAYFDRREET